MVVVVKVSGVEARIEDGVWSSEADAVAELLEEVTPADSGGPSEPDPDYYRAVQALARLGLGKAAIVAVEVADAGGDEEGRVY
jgi:beta-phosphoglucomutase-like phosphatase (HAD superfamily)